MQKFTEKTYLEDDACLPETYLQDEAIFSGFEQTEKVRQKMYALLRQIARNSPTKRICKTMHVLALSANSSKNVSARRCMLLETYLQDDAIFEV